MEAAASLRSTLLRNVLSSLDQPLSPERTAAIAQLLVGSGLLAAGPDGSQGGLWAPVTDLQGKLVEALLKQITKGEVSFRPGAAVLLGVVCAHVPARPFLSSYSDWAAALLEALRRDSDTAARAAALHAVGQLFTRVRELVDVPGVKREASGIAGRTLQLATPLLADAGCRAAALAAATAVLQALPSVARNHVAPLEQQLAALMAARDTSLKARGNAAAALALLPRAVAADAPAWSSLCRRTLLSLHAGIDLLLYHGGAGGGWGESGAPDGGLGARAREQLAAPGEGTAAADAEGLLGPAGFMSAAVAIGGSAGGRPGVAHTVQVTSALLDLLAALLAGGSTSAVPVPCHGLLLLVMRLLKLDAAVLLAPGRVAPSSSGLAEVLAALPGLHCAAWRLLRLLCRAVGSGVVPLLALAGRMVGEQLRRVKAGGAGGLGCAMPATVRTCMYEATVAVLRTGGFGAGRLLATEAVGTLVTELYGLSAVQQQQNHQAALYGASALGKSGASGGRSALGSPPPSKKARVGGAGDPLASPDLSAAAAVAAAAAPVSSPADVAAQTAALAVAEALLQVYGPALTSDLRGQLDALSYHLAAVCADADYQVLRDASPAAVARGPEVAALRVAATRALVASLAAPWPSRPAFLAEGLELLQGGAAGGGGLELAGVCREGLLAVEGVLRPRGMPLGCGGGGAGGEAGAAGVQGWQLPRPRLWSILDPAQPQLPPPTPATQPAAAAVAVAGVTEPAAAVAAVAAAAAAAAAPQPRAAAAVPAEAPAAVAGPGKQTGSEPMVAHGGDKRAAGSKAAADGGSTPAGGKAGVRGAKAAAADTPAPATAAKAAPAGAPSAVAGTRRKRGAENGAAPQGEACKGDTVEAKPAAATPAAPVAALAPAAAGAAVAPQAAAAAVFADESEDSEGSLPEIDSGDLSGSGEDE